ncbi:MAG: decaprenyl-phosphate phosphoribosyltransferase [Actinomycetota bacterium]|nr:decaprenyl-phosphate phosphoribosyltransferase [Actinomycetota bacterium]
MPTATPIPQSRPPRSRRADPREQGRPAAERIPAEHGGIRPWVRAVRPRQWAKNLLVFAAPAAAGTLGRSGVLLHVALAFVVFCLLASGAYLINDARDAPEDRRHPVKRHRPIASGAVSPEMAAAVGAICVALGIWLALAVSDALCIAACAYAALNVAYTTWLRRVAIADIAAIAAAFVLRALGGGIAAQVAISRWFILVVSFAALFVAAGKRYADFLDPETRRSRRVLEQYTAEFLRLVICVSCAGALGAYSLWAFAAGVPLARELTIIPFILAMLRYGLLVTSGSGGAPENVIFGDRFMQVTGLAWVVMFGLGV